MHRLFAGFNFSHATKVFCLGGAATLFPDYAFGNGGLVKFKEFIRYQHDENPRFRNMTYHELLQTILYDLDKLPYSTFIILSLLKECPLVIYPDI